VPLAGGGIGVHHREDRARALESLLDEVTSCRKCPRLVSWREQVARERRLAYRDEVYWGRPVPGFGDLDASIVVVGLAPAAHGGNRTGRIFTGDRSGDWLFRALWRAGLANQAESRERGDGLTLSGAYVTAVLRCAPPGNRPSTGERDRCLPYLERELGLLSEARVVVALGGFAYAALARMYGVRPRPSFGHGREVEVPGSQDVKTILCSFHPSQQNTFTGRLTEGMLDQIFERARDLAGQGKAGFTG